MKKLSKKTRKINGYYAQYKKLVKEHPEAAIYSAGKVKGTDKAIMNHNEFKDIWNDLSGTSKQKWKKIKESFLYESSYNTARGFFKVVEKDNAEYKEMNKKDRAKYRKQKITELRKMHSWDIYEEYKDQIEAEKERLRALNKTNKEINDYISMNYFGS